MADRFRLVDWIGIDSRAETPVCLVMEDGPFLTRRSLVELIGIDSVWHSGKEWHCAQGFVPVRALGDVAKHTLALAALGFESCQIGIDDLAPLTTLAQDMLTLARKRSFARRVPEEGAE